MVNWRSPVVFLLGLQFLAVILYPPAFFAGAPQAAVLPPTLVLLLIVALAVTNTGGLSPEAGRSSLNFVQGINIVVRLMMLLPNVRADGVWDWAFLITEALGIGLSWYAMTRMDKLQPTALLLKRKS
jgi:hypothetical protein